MDSTSTVANTADPPPDIITRLEFKEAQYYLTQILGDFDNAPEYSGSIMRLLIQDAMSYAGDWDTDSFLDNAVYSIEQAVPDSSMAFEIARQAGLLINQQLNAYLDEFSIQRYSGKYTYAFIGESNGLIQVNYWHNGVPSGSAQNAAEALL